MSWTINQKEIQFAAAIGLDPIFILPSALRRAFKNTFLFVTKHEKCV
jgi:hypothetical protein